MSNIAMFILSNKISGAERIALDSAAEASKSENMFFISPKGGLEVDCKNKNIDWIEINTNSRFLIIRQLKNIIKINQIKVLHCHDNKASYIALITKMLFKLNIAIISHVHNTYPFIKNGGAMKVIDRVFRRKFDLNIFCSKLVDEYFKDNCSYYTHLKKSIIIENATSISRNKNSAINFKYKNIDLINYDKIKKLKNECKMLFGFVGRFTDQKGVIEFITKLQDEVELVSGEYNFVLIGQGEQKSQIQKFIINAGLDEVVHIFDYFDNIFPVLYLFDYFILPSKYEGLPIVLLEAMSLKIPCLSMNVGGISQLIDNNNGLITPKLGYDIKQFMGLIYKAIKISENDYKEMRGNAYKTIECGFDIKNYTNRLIGVYNEYKS